MKTTRLAALAVLCLSLPLAAVLAQEAKAPATPGRYLPVPRMLGVLDTASGAIALMDERTNEAITIDLPGCQAFVRPVAKDASGWGAVDLPKLDPAVVPARGSVFLLVELFPEKFPGVVDTRTGAIYHLDDDHGPVAEWKDKKVVRLDPVLGTRTIRDLRVSKRGG